MAKVNVIQLITNGSMTGTSTISSETLNVSTYKSGSIEFAWTGTPTGTISVLQSISSVNYFALTFPSSLSNPSGSAGGLLISLDEISFPFLLLKYTNASGSGTLNAWFWSRDLI